MTKEHLIKASEQEYMCIIPKSNSIRYAPEVRKPNALVAKSKVDALPAVSHSWGGV